MLVSDSLSTVLGAINPADPSTCTIPESWSQGRAAFGGLVTALALRSIDERSTLPEVGNRPLRTVHTFFTAPVGTGPLQLDTRLIRQGKSITSVETSLIQEDQERAMVRAIYAARRPSSVHVQGPPVPSIPPPDKLVEIAFVEGVLPSFVQYFDLRWAYGGLPFTGSTEKELGGWCRLRDGDVCGTEAIAALMDAWPSPVVPMLAEPAPASSVTWCLDLLDAKQETRATDWHQYGSVVEFASEGYAFMTSYLWSSEGTLLARATQTVAVFG